MFDQLDRLNGIALSLDKADSLLGFMSDYFKYDKPDEQSLTLRYKMYADMFMVITDLVSAQKAAIDEVSDQIYEMAKTFTK